MGITGGFGTTIDLERGTSRQWVIGCDGVKRWADTNEPVENLPEMPTCTKSQTADFVSVPTISMRQLHLDDGSYGVALTVTGLASEQQAEAAMAHMQRLFCGAEISEQWRRTQ